MALLSLAASYGCKRHASRRATGGTTKPTSCLTIVAWNDLHGQIEAEAAQLDIGRVPAGGVVALADHIADARATGDAVVVLDAGDLFTGPMESTLAEGAPIVAAYRVLGVDAAAVGNHEFDFGPTGYARVLAAPGIGDSAGPDGPRGALLARMNEASFVFVAANVRYTDGAPVAWRGFAPHTVIKRGRFLVGVVGYTTRETPNTTMRPNVEGLLFANGAEKVKESIRTLRTQGASPIVLLAHASLEGELPQSIGPLDRPGGSVDPRGDKAVGEIATVLDALGSELPDLVIAGHRHAWMLGRVRGVPIVSTDQHAIGHARIRYCAAAKGPPGRTSFEGIERRVTFASDPPRTELGRKVLETVKPWVDEVREHADELVTKLPRTCYPQSPTGSAFAQQVASAMLERARQEHLLGDGPAIAVINSGGVRMPLLMGQVRYRDVFAALPFENSIAVCTTTRAGMIRGIKNLVGRLATRDRFPFGLAGGRVRTQRINGIPELVSLDVDGAATPPLSDDTPVTLVMPDFLLYGGDGFLEGVTCTSPAVSPVRVRDAFRDVLARDGGGCDGTATNVTVDSK